MPPFKNNISSWFLFSPFSKLRKCACELRMPVRNVLSSTLRSSDLTRASEWEKRAINSIIDPSLSSLFPGHPSINPGHPPRDSSFWPPKAPCGPPLGLYRESRIGIFYSHPFPFSRKSLLVTIVVKNPNLVLRKKKKNPSLVSTIKPLINWARTHLIVFKFMPFIFKFESSLIVLNLSQIFRRIYLSIFLHDLR